MSAWFESGMTWLVQEFQNPLVLFGFTAQFVFFMRFFVQCIESERRGRSTIPVSFWWLTLAGGTLTFIYALQKRDIVFMFSQALATFIYLRNLMLIYRPRAIPGALPVAPQATPESAGPSESPLTRPARDHDTRGVWTLDP